MNGTWQSNQKTTSTSEAWVSGLLYGQKVTQMEKTNFLMAPMHQFHASMKCKVTRLQGFVLPQTRLQVPTCT